MACRRGCSSKALAYTEAEDEIHRYVGTPCWKGDGSYYSADKVNAGVAMLIGKLKELEKAR